MSIDEFCRLSCCSCMAGGVTSRSPEVFRCLKRCQLRPRKEPLRSGSGLVSEAGSSK